MKILYLLRHAKSSWDDSSIPDRDRPLNDRGRRAANIISEYLRSHDMFPELVVCSSARRAVETLESLAPDLEHAAEVDLEDDLYLADAATLLERIRSVPAGVPSLMIIGHNPGMHELAVNLASEGEQLTELTDKFPTAAVAVIVFDRDDWNVKSGAGRLQSFVRPRDLE
jgi:phosphohistidine phosphatase